MRSNDILNPQSVFDDAPAQPAARQNYMGQSAFAVIMACILSLFIFPIGLFFGLAGSFVFIPDIAGDTDTYIGAVVVGTVGLFVTVGLLITFWINRMHNYAVTIMGLAYLVGALLGFALIFFVYNVAGADALL